ncbi:MAG: hypothetical protein EAZ58_13120 [Flavobacterium sp.]|nr:MAG: hypothetical protein EAZ58_13120 [Flavobacterium sp.]
MRQSTYLFFLSLLFLSFSTRGQHHSKLEVTVNWVAKSLYVAQEIHFNNDSGDTLKTIVLNDWNHAYSDLSTPLSKRFSDEFYRGFHLSKKEERGGTFNLSIRDTELQEMSWERLNKKPDVIEIQLKKPLLPGENLIIQLNYLAKIPSDKFTGIGYSAKKMNLKNWFISPARYENHAFTKNSNANLEDIANALSSFDVILKVPLNYAVTTDLKALKKDSDNNATTYQLSDDNRSDFSL